MMRAGKDIRATERELVCVRSGRLYWATPNCACSGGESKRKQKQMADDSVFRSGIMLRIGKTEEIERQFNEG